MSTGALAGSLAGSVWTGLEAGPLAVSEVSGADSDGDGPSVGPLGVGVGVAVPDGVGVGVPGVSDGGVGDGVTDGLGDVPPVLPLCCSRPRASSSP